MDYYLNLFFLCFSTRYIRLTFLPSMLEMQTEAEMNKHTKGNTFPPQKKAHVQQLGWMSACLILSREEKPRPSADCRLSRVQP